MNKIVKASIVATALVTSLAGCVITPVEPYGYGPVAQVGVGYVAPTYANPAPGYVWARHGYHGWGWRHPHRGWHRGWR